MPSYENLAIFFGVIIGLGLLGFFLYRAFSSHLRPFFIVGMAWKTALLSFKTNPFALLLALILIAGGRGLQRYFNANPIFDEATLLTLSIAWQAFLNMALAMIAIGIHLRTIDFVRLRYGLDDFELRRSYAGKLIPSAIYGGIIWAIGWGTLAGARYILGTTATNHPNLFANGLSFLLYIQASLLMLVRPAYSLELKFPMFQGIAAALRAAPSLLIVQACLSIPIVIYNISFLKFVTHVPQGALLTTLMGDMIFVLFSTLQFFSVEAAAIMLMARMELSKFVFKKSYG